MQGRSPALLFFGNKEEYPFMNSEAKLSVPALFGQLTNLWPAVLVAVLIFFSLPGTVPVLQQIPDRLEMPSPEEPGPDPAPAAAAEEERAEGHFEDGVFEGTAGGYGGPVTVRVTVEGGSITSVEILDSSKETASFFSRALAVIEDVLRKQTWEVDTVSGATYSSRGILGAIQNALTGETVDNEPAPEQEMPEGDPESEPDVEIGNLPDGTYTGSAQGFGGTIRVRVTVKDGRITDVTVTDYSGETASYYSRAAAVLDRMRASGSPNVDTVSGATYSSAGIINAVKRALGAAAGPDPAPQQEAETDVPVDDGPEADRPERLYLDGVYTGSGEGFGGEIVVQATITEGRIAAVEILSAEEETPSYLKRAQTLLTSVLRRQSPDVDTVSGATYSSEGILEGLKEALKKAETAQGDPSQGGEETPAPAPGPEGEPAPTPTPTPEPQDEEEPHSDVPTPSPEPVSDSKYLDGTYRAEAVCFDEEDELFDYQILVTVTIQDGAIHSVQVEKGEDRSEDPEDNDSYLERAVNGRTRKGVFYPGIPAQAVEKQSAETDAVSGATWSSDAIRRAVGDALAEAREAKAEADARKTQEAEQKEPEAPEEGRPSGPAAEQDETGGRSGKDPAEQPAEESSGIPEPEQESGKEKDGSDTSGGDTKEKEPEDPGAAETDGPSAAGEEET